MLVEVTAGLVPPCIYLKPLSLGLAVQRALFCRVLCIVAAGGALAGGSKIDDVSHTYARRWHDDAGEFLIHPLFANYADTVAVDLPASAGATAFITTIIWSL